MAHGAAREGGAGVRPLHHAARVHRRGQAPAQLRALHHASVGHSACAAASPTPSKCSAGACATARPTPSKCSACACSRDSLSQGGACSSPHWSASGVLGAFCSFLMSALDHCRGAAFISALIWCWEGHGVCVRMEADSAICRAVTLLCEQMHDYFLQAIPSSQFGLVLVTGLATRAMFMRLPARLKRHDFV